MPQFTFNPNDLHSLNRLIFQAGSASLDSEAGTHRSRRPGEGNDFLDFRPYVAGDDIRRVDWSVYARLRQLFVRLHEAPRQLSVSLLVDVSQSMLFGNPLTKLQQAQRIACAMGFIALRGGDRLLGTTFADGPRESLGPITGSHSFASLMKFLRNSQAGGKSNLLSTVSRLRAGGRCRGLVIVLSDFLNVPGTQDAFSMILGGGGRVVAFQVLDGLDYGNDLEGNLRLRDSETGSMVDVQIDPRTLAEYRTRFEHRRQLLEDFCNRRGQVYIRGNTGANAIELACTALRAKAVLR